MLLYHGTSLSCWEDIKKSELLPRKYGAKTNWEHTVESDVNTIYLTDCYALYFALQAANNSKANNEKAVVIEIDTSKLNREKFVADEDALEQVSRNMKGGDGLPPEMGMHERTVHYRELASDYAKAGYGHEWSLGVLGTCGYKGKISLEVITRVAIIDVKKESDLCWMFLDPSISIVNYKFAGSKYRSYSKAIFGDEPASEDLQAMESFMMPFQQLERSGIVIEEVSLSKKTKPKKKQI